ncbi:MAG: hypothetical protein U5K74_13970 [Gemmatimonadaceae bacterium]|nr:hypothetical protein [Gemmatimonadaceae bacterium]
MRCRRDDDAGEDNSTQDWRVQLSRRAPLELTINATAAVASLDLTGLPLRRFALRTGAAATAVRFDAPNPESMSVFDAEVGAGGMKLIGLGNAGASEVRIEGDVGDIALDLGGRWQRDLRLDVTSAIGNVDITAPPTIGIELTSRGPMLHAVSKDFTAPAACRPARTSMPASMKVRITSSRCRNDADSRYVASRNSLQW